MRMFRGAVYPALIATVLFLSSSSLQATNASTLSERLLRRQTTSSEPEQESTTQSNKNADDGNNQPVQLPPRLYPDLPRAPTGGFGHQLNQSPTPFIPFGRQLRPMPPMQPRPMNPSERLQSQTFTNGLGRRLLSMVGIEPSAAINSNETNSAPSDSEGRRRNPTNSMEETMRALQNSTVLQQLNRGVHSIYGGLSKMYNSTVQQQLDLLQERFKTESANSTNPWQQRMAQQVPQFFKSMAIRVNDAQENLNRVWSHITNQAINGTQMNSSASLQSNQQSRSFFNPYDQHPMINNGPYNEEDHPFQSGNFFNNLGRSLGFNNDPMGSNRPDGGDLGNQMRGFWVNQVQPQIGILRGQIARVWRDLTSSGMLAPEPMLVGRNNGNNLVGQATDGAVSEKSPDFIDNILKGLNIDMSGQDFALVEPKADQQQGTQQQQQQSDSKSNVGMQMQNRLINMQRELNLLWNGLSNSLRNAISNVRSAMNPQPQFGPIDGMTSSNKNQQEVDAAENEIDSTIKGLSKLQKEADVVHDVVQRQQQAQQRQNFGQRFRNFFSDVSDLSIDQLPNRFGDSVSRFGNAVGDFWNQIPRRWDNFMQNARYDQPIMANAPLKAANNTQKP